MIGSSGWVPTLQMSAYVRARPARRLARHPHDGGPGRRWDGRQDVRACGTAGATWWRSPPSWPGCASPTSPADGPLGPVHGAASGGLRPRPRRHPRRRRRRSSPTSSSPARATPDGSGSAGTALSSRWRSLSMCRWCAWRSPFPDPYRCPNAKEPLPWWEAAPRRQDWSESSTASGPPPPGSAWGSRKSVLRTWQGATHPGSCPPAGTGRTGRGRVLLVMICSVYE